MSETEASVEAIMALGLLHGAPTQMQTLIQNGADVQPVTGVSACIKYHGL